MPLFRELGRALRWLRDSQGKRQYQVAEAAWVTKAMLSAYETGKQKPSLDTLERLLEALESDLADLHRALQIAGEGRGEWRPALEERPLPAARTAPPPAARSELARMVGLAGPLPPEEERALAEMMQALTRLLRFLHARAAAASRAAELAAPVPRR